MLGTVLEARVAAPSSHRSHGFACAPVAGSVLATVTCLSNVVNGVLRVTSNGSDSITISRSPTDTIRVNGTGCLI